ncbi:MAG: VWA domain-containing protein [Candidatus Loosdrechtia sp.]|uniref:VWA domain-containing protein n=1 Tax=Candidatus Loosdrechtia sp. TaxID=3101272 RepID=UPI003A76A8DE|nr:MAG: VWA domain-containing protein [Candidatus Jettenia sp. AMX2]
MKKISYKKIIYSFIGITLIAIIVLIYLGRVDPVLKTTQTELHFGEKEARQLLTLKNIGEKKWRYLSYVKTLYYEVDITRGGEWISIPLRSGTCERHEEKQITVTVNRDMLSEGINQGEILVKSNGGNKTIRIVAIGIKEEKILRILNPSDNAALTIDEQITIQWSATPNISNYADIFLLKNGFVVENIARSYHYRNDTRSNGRFTWTPKSPLRPGEEKYAIKIVDISDREVFGLVSSLRIVSPLTKLFLKNITTAHQKPSTIQFVFSLRDQDDHAVLIDPANFDMNNLKIWENDKKIDYLESNPYLYRQDDFCLQVMLVLDFSASIKMYRNGVETMVVGANSLIDHLKDTHQIGIVEFHRPDAAPSIIQPFTTHKQKAREEILNFSQKNIYSDFSICWDAVYHGLKQFPEEPDPKTFRTLVFISDGFDNSSLRQPEDLISLANKRDVHIYSIGLGKVRKDEILENISGKTGGTYIRAEDIRVFLERFKQIIIDLGGQYKTSYITPKKPEDGIFTTKSEISYKGITGVPSLEDKVDPYHIFGKTNQGILSFDVSPLGDEENAEVFVWCEHVPRYINKFRFHLKTDKPYTITLVPENNGGICEEWNIIKEADGWYLLSSPNPNDLSYDLKFGRSGIICKINLEEIKEEQTEISFLLDNTVYHLGQAFYGREYPETDRNKIWQETIIISRQRKP